LNSKVSTAVNPLRWGRARTRRRLGPAPPSTLPGEPASTRARRRGGRLGPASQRRTLAVPAQMLLEHVTALASRCELDMAPRRRLGRRCLLLWWGSLLLWWGSLLLWWGSFLLSWGGLRLLCSRWRCRDRRLERLSRCRDLWGRIRRDLPQGGWPDQCGEARSDRVHRFVRRGMSPLRSEPGRHRQLCSTDHAQGGAYQGCDHRILSMYSPPTHSHRLRRRYPLIVRCGRTPTQPSRPRP
jgi:hypothetical protein